MWVRAIAVCLCAQLVAAHPQQEVLDKIEKLKRLTIEQTHQLNSLVTTPAKSKSRRLLVAETTQLYDGMPSIFGDQEGMIEYDFKTVNGTRAYTPQEQVQECLRHVWLILMGAVVFMMQAGFALLEAGTARFVHVEHTLMKNMITTLISGIMWWLFGYSFAFSGRFRVDDAIERSDKPLFKETAILGSDQFIGHHFLFGRPDGQVEPTAALVEFFFSWAVCATATSIATGAMIERVRLPAYILFSILMSGFIYPVSAAWTVGHGWLSDATNTGYYDWAGGGYVHMLGGWVGLIAAIVSGARENRFDPSIDFKTRLMEVPEQFWPHSQPLIVLGTLLLWFGFYGMACGANNIMEDIEQGFMTAHIAMVLTIAAAAGGFTGALAKFVHAGQQYDTGAMCNGIISGIVSVLAGCGTYGAGEALAVAIIGACFYYITSCIIKACKVDDPLDVFAVHGVSGMWSLFGALLFDWAVRFETWSFFAGFRCYRNSPATGDESTPTGQAEVEECLENLSGSAWGAMFMYLICIPLMGCILTLICLVPMKLLGLWRLSESTQAKGTDPEIYGSRQAYTPYWQKNDVQDEENYL